MNYTKGEWKAKYDHAMASHYVAAETQIPGAKQSMTICELIAGEDDKANAHLIAAAPEMYEALRNLLSSLHAYYTLDMLEQTDWEPLANHIKVAKQVLAKAEE